MFPGPGLSGVRNLSGPLASGNGSLTHHHPPPHTSRSIVPPSHPSSRSAYTPDPTHHPSYPLPSSHPSRTSTASRSFTPTASHRYSGSRPTTPLISSSGARQGPLNLVKQRDDPRMRQSDGDRDQNSNSKLPHTHQTTAPPTSDTTHRSSSKSTASQHSSTQSPLSLSRLSKDANPRSGRTIGDKTRLTIGTDRGKDASPIDRSMTQSVVFDPHVQKMSPTNQPTSRPPSRNQTGAMIAPIRSAMKTPPARPRPESDPDLDLQDEHRIDSLTAINTHRNRSTPAPDEKKVQHHDTLSEISNTRPIKVDPVKLSKTVEAARKAAESDRKKSK